LPDTFTRTFIDRRWSQFVTTSAS